MAVVATYTHGQKCVVESNGYDDTDFVNDLTIIGFPYVYNTTDEFTGNGVTTQYTVTNPPTSSVNVTVNSVYKQPDIDYITNIDSRLVTFTTPPTNGHLIRISYDFIQPVFVRVVNQASIDSVGSHARRLTLTWIRSTGDGILFGGQYLNAFSTVRPLVKITLPIIDNYIKENDLIKVISSVTNQNSDYVVKSVQHTFPQYHTIITAGEYRLSDLELQKLMYQKIHNLETAVLGTKDIKRYDIFADNLNFSESVFYTVTNRAFYSKTSTYSKNYAYSSP